MSKPLATWRLLNLELAIDEPESNLRQRAATIAGVSEDRLRGFRIKPQVLSRLRA